MVNSEVLERKGKREVFYQVLTLHRTLFWALRRSIEWKTALSLEFGGGGGGVVVGGWGLSRSLQTK